MRRDLGVQEAVLGCRLCDPRMVNNRNTIVLAQPGKTYWEGGLAFMTDAPGPADDDSGKPLTPTTTRGRLNTGATFHNLLKAADIDRENVLVMTRIRCFPPRSRIGDFPEALTNCDPWTVLELEAYKPGVVVLMGGVALAPVYGANPKVGELRSTWRKTEKFDWGSRLWLATYHPAAVLRNPELTEEVVEDFRKAYDEALPF